MESSSSLSRFLAELKRRHVYRVAAVYAATAFVVVQVADLTFVRLGLPPWTVTLVIVLAALGFPIALVLAWAFEVSPEGVRRTEPAAADARWEAPRLGTVLGLVAGLVVLSAGGWWLHGAGGRSAAGIQRLAVLPMANLMNDPGQEYFVQGMHDGLISELQRVGVPVIARTSVMRYADGETPAREIARELDVDGLVEATVYRAGDSVEIDARLVDPESEEYLWSASFGAGLRNVISLQRELARGIAGEIQAALAPEDEARLTEASPVEPQAYEAYLKGVFHAQRFTPEDFTTALEYFKTALEADSTFAPAHVGVARVWQFRGQAARFTGVTPREARRHALPALERALELDPDLAEAHMAVGWLRTWNEWRFEEGHAALERAVRLNPGHAEARVFYGHLLAILGSWYEARQQAEKAVELDPLNPFIRALHPVVLSLTRRYEEAIRVAKELYREHPTAPGFGRTALIRSYHLLGRHEDALAAIRERYESRDKKLVAVLEGGYREGGYQEALRRLADTLVARDGSAGEPRRGPWGLYAMAGAADEVLRWLEHAVEAGSQDVPYMGVAPILEPLHDDPRFRELADRVGVPVLNGPVEL